MTRNKADNKPSLAAAASIGSHITIGAGQTATVTAVVSGGAVTNIEIGKTEFNPELVIDYHPGSGASYDTDEKSGLHFDPRYVLEGGPNKIWSLGLEGWIILGFPEGIPASPDYRVLLRERGDLPEFVDFYIARNIDNTSPAAHQASHPINGVLGTAPDTQNDFRQATTDQTRPGPYWPPWVPQDSWLYLGWIKGQTNSATKGNLTLANIPYGKYYYLLLHDRNNEAPGGADIESVKIVQRANANDVRLVMILDNSNSASSEIEKYKNHVRFVIETLPIHGRQAWISVRFIEDLRVFNVTMDPVERAATIKRINDARSTDGTEAAIRTKRHQFSNINGNIVHWKLVSHENRTDVANEICNKITMNKFTSPILSALMAVEKEEIAEVKVELNKPRRSATELRILLFTDGLPDPYNDYTTPAGLPQDKKNEVKNRIIGDIKNKINDFRAYLRPQDMRLIGDYEPNGTWLRDLWRVELGGSISVLSMMDENAAPNNMHEVAHTDCLNGSKEKMKRIGDDPKEKERPAHQPPPHPSVPKAWK